MSESRLAMDTVVSIKAWGPNARQAIEAGFKVFETLESQLSFHVETSELSKLNKLKTINTDNEHLLKVLRLAEKYHGKTDGYFDPTFSALNRLYGFYAESSDMPAEPPTEGLLAQTLAKQTGLLRLLSIKQNEIELDKEAELDLGGIVGGYAVRLAAEAMLEAGCRTFLIDDAGDIMVHGTKSNRSPWVIGVLNPIAGKTFARAHLSSTECISTSGNYERYVVIGDKKYGHIMNPHTGKPAEEFVSVSVVTASPEEADIYSTALFAMPKERALQKAEELNLPALFITADGEVTLSTLGKAYFHLLK